MYPQLKHHISPLVRLLKFFCFSVSKKSNLNNNTKLFKKKKPVKNIQTNKNYFRTIFIFCFFYMFLICLFAKRFIVVIIYYSACYLLFNYMRLVNEDAQNMLQFNVNIFSIIVKGLFFI